MPAQTPATDRYLEIADNWAEDVERPRNEVAVENGGLAMLIAADEISARLTEIVERLTQIEHRMRNLNR